MMVQKVTPSVYYNQWLKRLNTQLNESTNQNPIKVPKVVKPTNIKTLLKTLRTINSQLVPSFLGRHQYLGDQIYAMLVDINLFLLMFLTLQSAPNWLHWKQSKKSVSP